MADVPPEDLNPTPDRVIPSTPNLVDPTPSPVPTPAPIPSLPPIPLSVIEQVLMLFVPEIDALVAAENNPILTFAWGFLRQMIEANAPALKARMLAKFHKS